MVDHRALAETLDSFAATVTGEFSTADILRQLAQAATRVLDVDGVGVMAPQDGDLLRFAFATTGPVEEVERLQEEHRGPCTEAAQSGEVLNMGDLARDGRWPAYQARAASLGLAAVCAVPLRARGRLWGVLDTYRTAARSLDEDELAAAQTLANLATSYLVVTADRDAAREAQQALAHRAMHDPLTELPVRWVMLEQLGRALARLHRADTHVAVLFLDLDGLKYVNDTYGHAAGDLLLTTCVARIRSALRPQDVLARLGGDEFVVLLEDLDDEAAAAVGHRIASRLEAPYRPDGQVISPSASIGVAVTDDPTSTPDTLIAHADAAMYRAKQGGRGRVEVFDLTRYTTDRADVRDRRELLLGLRAAVVADALELYYQPILDLTEGRPEPGVAPAPMWGVEALLRWRHPQRGLLSASEFIEAAEQSGLISEIGPWVLRTALSQLARWSRREAGAAPTRLFVNLSVSELTRPDLCRMVASALASTDIAPDRLVLEITEGGMLSDSEAGLSAVRALQELGCRIAIDDFGAGYSSLGRLVRIPADIIKVDQSFARDVVDNQAASAVVKSVLLLGDALDRTVVVEGIADPAILGQLRELGVTHGQGFHLAAPMSGDELIAHMARSA